MPERMKEADLKGLVAREISLAQSDRAALSKKQTKALEYFQGKMSDIQAEVGRSSAISRDLADTMGWMLPGIIRVFTASEHMAIAEPVGKEDMDWAAQATDGINYTFWKENDGYRIVYNATWDSLLSANGVVKTYWDDTPRHEVSFHSGLSDDQLALLIGPDEVEVIAHSEEMKTSEDGIPYLCHDVKIKRLIAKGKTCVEAIPPEDYGINSGAKTCEDARFQYHKAEKTRSELIEMGYDRKVVDALGKSPENDTSEEVARQDSARSEDSDPSMEVVDFYECYIKVDVDGDGIAETVRVMYAGNSGGGEILDWEEWEDDTPFDDIPCNPMPHRWEAQSIADETMDVQQIKTVLIRQALDNTYAANNPQRFVKGKITNPDELFSPSFGGAIFGDANSEVINLAIPFVANHAYDAINYQDQVIERRTGVSRQTMALDPEALQNQTATANQNAKDAAYSQIELVARNQAELGWKKVFRKILKLEVKHQDKPRTIRMGGKFVEIDPRHWNADMDISINVGLGTGSRDRDMQMLQSVLGNQVMLASSFRDGGFPDKALEMLPYILTTMSKSAEAAGIKSPEVFYPDVTPEDIEAGKAKLAEMQQQPDPKVLIEQAKIQANTEAETVKAQANMVKEKAQLEADLQTKEADRQNQLMIEAQKQQFEREKLAEDSRQKELDREQQWQLEMLKINAAAHRAEKSGAQSRELELAKLGAKDEGGKIVGKEDRMSEVLERLMASQNAPKRIVRDPATGRALGIETVAD